jgi:Tfp pilus assembly protein PilZ
MMRSWKSRSALTALGLCVSVGVLANWGDASSPARGEIGARVYVTIPDLTLENQELISTDIVRATVVSTHKVRGTSGKPCMETRVSVRNNLKGDATGELRVRVIGDGETLVAPQAPRFRVGEEVVLFLAPQSNPEYFTLVGLRQGVVRVGTEDKLTGWHVREDEGYPAFRQRVAECTLAGRERMKNAVEEAR